MRALETFKETVKARKVTAGQQLELSSVPSLRNKRIQCSSKKKKNNNQKQAHTFIRVNKVLLKKQLKAHPRKYFSLIVLYLFLFTKVSLKTTIPAI